LLRIRQEISNDTRRQNTAALHDRVHDLRCMTETCFSCGGRHTKTSGPTHPYMLSSRSCWASYGQILEKEYSDARYWKNHQLNVDAYAVQHPGDNCARSVQSVALHLISMYFIFEKQLPQNQVPRISSQASEFTFKFLEPADSFGYITVGDVLASEDHVEHNMIVQRWAKSSFDAWEKHHETIKDWVASIYT